jgi:hypothetical protein
MEDEMGRIYNTHGKMTNSCKILSGKPERKTQLGIRT